MAIFCLHHPMHRQLCLVLAALMLLGPATPAAAQQAREQPAGRRAAPSAPPAADATRPAVEDLDAQFIAPGACVIVALRPAQFFRSPLAEWLPTEVIQTASTLETGLDPLQAETLVLSFSLPTNYVAYASFQGKVAPKEGEWTKHTAAGELNGNLYLKSKTPLEPSFYQPNERSLLLAPDYLVSQIAAGKTPPATPFITQFAAAASDADAFVMVDVGALRPMINMGLAQAQLPPEAQSLARLPGLIKSASLRVNFSTSSPSEAIIAANDEAAAQGIVDIFEDAKTLLSQQMAREADRMLSSPDPVEQGTGRYIVRMSKTWNERLQLTREGDKIVLFRADLTESGLMASPMVIGVLVALLLPAVQAARAAARRNAAMNNMKQLMLSMLNYESVNGSFPAHASYSPDGKPLLSWRVHVLPFLEQKDLYDQFRLDEPWDSEHNKKLIALMPDVFRDPASSANAEGKSNYLGVAGDGFVFDGTGQGRALATIEDGLSHTIALVQVGDDAAEIWTKPADWSPGDGNPMQGLGELHTGGIFLSGFCDGHVSAVSTQIDLATFMSLLTASGGENVPAR